MGSVNKQYGQKTGMCGSNHVVRGGKLNYSVVSELSCVVDEHVVHPVDRYMHRLAVLLGPPPPPTHSFLSHRQPMRQYATPVMSFPVHSSGHNGGCVRSFMCLSNITLFHRLFSPL